MTPWSLPLWDWQREAVLDWGARRPKDYLAVVTPGGGKTLFAAAVSYGALDGGFIERVVAVVPTTPLRRQWAVSLANVGIQLDPAFRTGAHLARDLHGAVMTYQQVMEDPRFFHSLTSRRNTLVVFDEIHHAAEQAAWGNSIIESFTDAAYRLHLSGTPFNTKEAKVAFLQYDQRGYVQADYLYPYTSGLKDGVVRPIVCHPQSARVKWRWVDGVEREATFEDVLPQKATSERLRAVLWHDGWVGEVLVRAQHVLEGVRRREGDVGGLALCMNEKHARFVASLIRELFGVEPVVVVSADPDADRRLAKFKHGTEQWLVAVRKVTEGVDIPRLRVEVFLTNYTTELFWRQATARVGRIREGRNDPGYVLFPADLRLVTLAERLEAEVKGRGFDDQQGLPDVIEGAGGGDASEEREIEVLEAEHGELAPITVKTVDPFANHAPIERGANVDDERTVVAYERAKLRTIFNSIVGSVCSEFDLQRKDVYSWWVKHDGHRVEALSVDGFRRRIATMRRWIESGRSPVRFR